MTVGLGARRLRIANRAAATAGSVVDDDGLAENPLEHGCDGTRGEICLSAGRKRHDHRNVAAGIDALCERSANYQTLCDRQAGSGEQKVASLHRSPPSSVIGASLSRIVQFGQRELSAAMQTQAAKG